MRNIVIFFIVIFELLSSKVLIVDDDYWMPVISDTCEDTNDTCFLMFKCKFSTITSALLYLDNGDTIRVCPGDYQESDLKIDKNSITIESTTGDDRNVTVHDDSDEDIFILSGYRKDITIQNITIEQNSSGYSAISVDRGKNIIFQGNSIESEGRGIYQNSNKNLKNISILDSNISAKDYGVYLEKPKNLHIQDVNISSINSFSIYLKSPSGDAIIDTSNGRTNSFSSKSSSIYLGNQSQNYTVTNSIFTINGDDSGAIAFDKTGDLNVSNITVYAQNRGVGVWSKGVVTGSFTLKNSKIYDSKNEPVYIKTVLGKSFITDNRIKGGGYAGIYLGESSNGGEIKRNVVSDIEYYGLLLLDNDNWRSFQIDHNCFIDNGTNAFSRDESASFDDGNEGNYWDDWCGVGSYRVGNIPRYDNHPLSQCPFTRDCNLNNGLMLSTYDISDYLQHYPYNHNDFDVLERDFAIDSKRFGIGVIDTIDTIGADNNPYHPDPDNQYLSIMEGYIDIPQDGEYRFAVNGDDAVEIIIDEQYYGWYNGHGRDSTDHNASFTLSAGLHKLKFRQEDWGQGDNYQLYWKKPGDSDFSIVPNSALYYCTLKARAEYQMNSCHWSSSSGEVKDSSDNGYDGTAHNADTTSDGFICRGANLSDSGSDYLDLNSNALNGVENFTISIWFKTSQSGDFTLLSGANSSESQEIVFAFQNGNKFKATIKGVSKTVDLGVNIADNRWHNAVWRRESNGLNCIMIDGNCKGCVRGLPKGALSIDTGGLIVGQKQGAVGGSFDSSKSFNGLLDELVVFDRFLSISKMKEIYQFQKVGNRYNGKRSYCINCAITPSCSNLVNGLDISTYDISDYSQHYPFSHSDYDSLESSFAKQSYRYGSGYLDKIDTLPRYEDNNPFHTDPDNQYLTLIEGYIYVDKSGEYRFAVNGDDAVEVIIDNQYYGWYSGHGIDSTTHNDKFIMEKGYHTIKFRQEDWDQGDSYQLFWKKPGDSDYSVIPKEAYYRCSSTPPASNAIFNAVSSIGSDSICDSPNDWDNNITTQIVQKPFDIYILSKDINSTTAIEANISKVTITYFNSGDNQSCQGEPYRESVICDGNCGNTDSNGCLKLSNISIDSAIKCAEVKILGSNGIENNSSDNFAIRPEYFKVTAPTTTLYAGEEFNIKFEAIDDSGDDSSDYNESENSSFVVDFNDTKAGCITGSTDRDSIIFSNGDSGSKSVTYSEIGDINISISEKSGSEFAKVDSDDTPLGDRYIESNSSTVTILPYEINVSSSSLTTATGVRWLYMAHNIDDMYIMPQATISIYNKSGDKMIDFNSSCYGKDVNVTFKYIYDGDSSAKLTLDGNLTNSDSSISDINKTVQMPKTLFNQGEGVAVYRFGIDRNYSNPINPIEIELKDITVDTANISKYRYSATDTSSIPSNSNITLYYGRVRAEDIRTNSSPITQKLYFEVYSSDESSPYISSFSRDSLNWYLNSYHDDAKYGTITINNSKAYRGLVIDSSPLDVNITAIRHNSDGTADLDIDIAPDTHGVVHLDSSVWLWYIPSEYGGEYDFSSGSSCSHHPCFNIDREKVLSDDNIIESGSFEGLDFNGSSRGDYKQRGIKVFR